MDPEFFITSKLWEYEGKAAWFFLTINKKTSKQIKSFTDGPRRGFGAVKVSVRIGISSWKTSIFPIKEGEYLLPIKAQIRKQESLKAGSTVKATITLI